VRRSATQHVGGYIKRKPENTTRDILRRNAAERADTRDEHSQSRRDASPARAIESKIHLQGMIPINSYTVTTIIDPGAPYRLVGRAAETKPCTLYGTKRPAGVYDAGKTGTCGAGIERIQQ